MSDKQVSIQAIQLGANVLGLHKAWLDKQDKSFASVLREAAALIDAHFGADAE